MAEYNSLAERKQRRDGSAAPAATEPTDATIVQQTNTHLEDSANAISEQQAAPELKKSAPNPPSVDNNAPEPESEQKPEKPSAPNTSQVKKKQVI